MTILLIIYALAVAALTWVEYKQNRKAQAWVKPLAALLFILIALGGGALYWQYGQWILWALLACAIGDVLLLSRDSPTKFKLGMAAFAIGHILYVVAFVSLSGLAGLSPLALLPVLAGGAYFYWVRPKLPADMVVPVAVYSLIIIAMVITSFGVPMIIVPIAAVMFAISDMFVARDRFVAEEPRNALAITPLYFGAQALFALSAAI